MKAGSAERRGPGCGTAVEGRSWLQAGSQMPVPAVRGGAEGVPQTDQCKWRVFIDSRGLRLVPRSLQGRVGIQAGKAGTTDATSCNSQVQAAPLGVAVGSEGQGKLAVGTGNWSSTWARRGSKWVDELSAGLEGP